MVDTNRLFLLQYTTFPDLLQVLYLSFPLNTQIYTHVTDKHLHNIHKQFHGKKRR